MLFSLQFIIPGCFRPPSGCVLYALHTRWVDPTGLRLRGSHVSTHSLRARSVQIQLSHINSYKFLSLEHVDEEIREAMHEKMVRYDIT